MSAIVLRGDWIKLHRRDDRIWVRERPYEVVWRTTASFTVDDIRSVEVETRQLELNRRRRLSAGRGSSRVLRPAVTRIVIDHGADELLTVDVKESVATVVEAFADLGDRLLARPVIDLVEEHARDEAGLDDLPRISWRADRADDDLVVEASHEDVIVEAAHEAVIDLVDLVDPVPERPGPEVVDDWLDRAAASTTSQRGAGASDEELFPADEVEPTGHGGAWVRKRKKRPIHHRVLRSSDARR